MQLSHLLPIACIALVCTASSAQQAPRTAQDCLEDIVACKGTKAVPADNLEVGVRATATGNHQVNVAFSNSQCKADLSCVNRNDPNFPTLVNCNCTAEIWRGQCSSATNCPDPNQGITNFLLLPNNNYLSVTVDANGSHWLYNDVDAKLTDAATFIYVVDNKWTDQTTPSKASAYLTSSPVTMPKAAVAHQATLNYTSSDCTTNAPCWIQLYRAICKPNCPVYSPDPTVWTSLVNATFPVWTTTATGTTWQALDDDPALADATKYVYVATVCFSPGCTSYSPASAPWSGTTQAGAAAPLAPTVGPGNTVTKNKQTNPFRKFLALFRGEK